MAEHIGQRCWRPVGFSKLVPARPGTVAPHFQLQGDGKLRMTFRNQTGSTIVDAPKVFVDGGEQSGEVYPVDEWVSLRRDIRRRRRPLGDVLRWRTD